MSLNKNIRGRVLIFSSIIFVLMVAAIIAFNYNSFFSKADVAKPSANSIAYYVSPTGAESADGKTLQTPTTLEGARNKIRLISKTNFPGAIVNIRGGNYYRTTSFDLVLEDSGTLTAPIIYQAYKDEKPVITGAKEVTGFVSANDARLNPAAKASIKQVDLKALGITNYGTLQDPPTNYSGNNVSFPMQLFFNNNPMILARYPNLGSVSTTTRAVSDAANEWSYVAPSDNRAIGETATVLKYADSDSAKVAAWKDLSDAWVHGYFSYDWKDVYQKISKIDPASKIITTTAPTNYKVGQWFYYENILEELDVPGEWYVDRATGILYFYPPAEITSTNTSVSVLSSYLINGRNTVDAAKKVSNIQFIGLNFSGTRAAGVALTGDNNAITNCEIQNTGAEGVIMTGAANTVEFSKIHDTGFSGIDLRSPSTDNYGRNTLIDSDNEINSNEIYNFGLRKRMGSMGVYIYGVGISVAHNYIYNGPRSAINFGGNNNTIEYNKISNVAYEVGDGGAIYGGADWTQRGNKIQYNMISDIQGIFGRGAIGVYLDDMLSGTTVYGNIFKNIKTLSIAFKPGTTTVDHDGGGAVLVGGGRDNMVKNNVFINCNIAVHVDPRGLNWAVKETQAGGVLFNNLKFVLNNNTIKALYEKNYPGLTNILNDNPGAPKGNVIASNINLGGIFLDWTLELKDYPSAKRAQTYITVGKNLNDYTVLARNADGSVLKPATKPVDVDPFTNSSSNDFSIKSVNKAAVDAVGFVALPAVSLFGPEKYVPSVFFEGGKTGETAPTPTPTPTPVSSKLTLSVKNFNYKGSSNKETVTIKNTGTKTVNFKGYKIKNAKKAVIILPNYSLKPGQSVVMHSARKYKWVTKSVKIAGFYVKVPQRQEVMSTTGHIYLQQANGLWNDRHDTFKLTKPYDTIIVKKSY